VWTGRGLFNQTKQFDFPTLGHFLAPRWSRSMAAEPILTFFWGGGMNKRGAALLVLVLRSFSAEKYKSPKKINSFWLLYFCIPPHILCSCGSHHRKAALILNESFFVFFLFCLVVFYLLGFDQREKEKKRAYKTQENILSSIRVKSLLRKISSTWRII